MDKIYGGWEEVTADDYNVDNTGAFPCYLDSGHTQVTIDNQILGAQRELWMEAWQSFTVPNYFLIMTESKLNIELSDGGTHL